MESLADEFEILAIGVLFVETHPTAFVEAVNQGEKEVPDRLGVISLGSASVGLLAVSDREPDAVFGLGLGCGSFPPADREYCPQIVDDEDDHHQEDEHTTGEEHPKQERVMGVEAAKPLHECHKLPPQPTARS